MKAVLNLLLLPIALIVLFTQCEKEPEIELVDIPDDAFLTALIELGVDTNGDGIISPAEAEAITSLDVSGVGWEGGSISDLTGIEAFVNLNVLLCLTNQLTSLDVSNNTLLNDLDCANNQLTSLDVSNNTYLTNLWCHENQLTTLDVSNNTALETLFCSSNQLANLDVSNNTALYYLHCDYNQLTSLDISNNTALKWLYFSNMPTLYQVCVWEMPFPPEGVYVYTSDSPNAYFTTECSK